MHWPLVRKNKSRSFLESIIEQLTEVAGKDFPEALADVNKKLEEEKKSFSKSVQIPTILFFDLYTRK